MASGGTASMVYDPLARLKQLDQGSTHNGFDYLGNTIATELDASNTTITRRYVPGPGTDEPVVWYEGSGTSDRRWLHTDERGSVIAVTNASGSSIGINSYDEYGIPAATNLGRFGYTGQAWLPELGMSYYKARIYSPTLGRFMQTDPISYDAGMNLYNYVDSDPVNNVDPFGLTDITVRGRSPSVPTPPIDVQNTFGNGYTPVVAVFEQDPIFVTAPRQNNAKPLRIKGNPGCNAPLTSYVGSARTVLEVVATGADVLTVGLVAGGVTGPAAGVTKLVGWSAEGWLFGINGYDAYVNRNYGPLAAQGAGLAGRLIPGGRALQGGLKAARGSTRGLRNSAGRFRTSRLNNPGIKEGGDLAAQKAAEGGAGLVVCGAQ